MLDLTTMKPAASTEMTPITDRGTERDWESSTSTARRRRSPPKGEAPTAVKGKADKPRKRWRRRLLLGITAVVLLLAGGAAVYAATQATVPKHEVPTVVGMTADQALGAGRRVRLEDRHAHDQYDDTHRRRPGHPAGSKAGDEAQGGRDLLAGRVARPTPVAVPDLTGMSDGQAGEALTNAGLVVVAPVTEAFDENVPAHFVVSWDPTGKEHPKGSPVNLVVSKGPAPRQVPQVSGSFADAKAALAGVQLKAKQVDVFSDTVPAGQVVSTQPASGASAPRGSDGHGERLEGSRSRGGPGDRTQEARRRDRDPRGRGAGKPARSYGPAKGRPISTNPGEGSMVPRGSAVDIYLG